MALENSKIYILLFITRIDHHLILHVHYICNKKGSNLKTSHKKESKSSFQPVYTPRVYVVWKDSLECGVNHHHGTAADDRHSDLLLIIVPYDSPVRTDRKQACSLVDSSLSVVLISQ